MASEAAVLEMEKKAAMRKRMNKAMADYAVNSTPTAQAQAREQAENNRQRDIASGAHERAMARRRQFIERNPFAVSPFERKAVLGDFQARQDQAALREHELEMVGKKNEGAIKVAEHNANGMINQGKSAAEINAGVRGKEIDAGLKKHELEMANRKDIAGIQSETQKSISAGQNQTTLEAERIRGKSAVEAQAEANKGLLAQSELKQKMEQERLANTLQNTLIKANGKLTADQAKQHTNIITAALRAGAANGKDTATVMAELRETYKNDPDMLKSLGAVSGGTNRFKD